MSTKIDVQTEQAFLEQYSQVLEQLYDKMEGSARGSLFNIVFSPHTTILARGGQTRKPIRASRPRLGLNGKRMHAGQAKMFKSKRTR